MTKKFLPLTLTILTVGLISYALLNPCLLYTSGLILYLILYPPIMMDSVLIAAFYIITLKTLSEKRVNN